MLSNGFEHRPCYGGRLKAVQGEHWPTRGRLETAHRTSDDRL